MGERIRKVVIVGRDAAAWLSALTLQSSFGNRDTPVEVELIELPSLLRPQDAYVTLPSQQAFHRLLGLDEHRLLRACGGTYSLGQRFSNFSGADAAFMHPYDSHGISLSHVDFFQYWLKARARGLEVPLDEFSLGAAAARQGRFIVFNESTEVFSKATYGYHLDAIRYLRAIGKAAIKKGLKHTAAALTSVDAVEGSIRSVKLDNGRTVEADLFVDASGEEACLITQVENNHNFESWRSWLPCDHVAVGSAAVLEPIPAFSQVSAFRGGWLGIYPLMDRTAVVCTWSGRHMEAKDVSHTITALSGLAIEGDLFASSLEAGTRQAQWIGNCVAIGDTAARLEALDATQLQMLHTGLSYLVSLFPVHREHMPERAIYNRKMQAHALGIRDFTISHYQLNRRFDEPLWDSARETAPPESLAAKLALFAARGIVAINDNETFQEENWTSILAGHRHLPKTWDPLVDKMPEQEQIEHFQRILKFVSTEVDNMPSLQAHLELNAPQSSSDYIF